MKIGMGWTGLACMVAVSLACACGSSPETDRGDRLLAIPFPDLEGRAEDIGRELDQRRVEFEQLLARGRTDADRALAYGELGRIYHAYGLLEPAAACYVNAARLAARPPSIPCARRSPNSSTCSPRVA